MSWARRRPCSILWRLVWGQPYIDSRTLAAAIEQDLARSDRPDFRTRLLVRDSAVALRSYWGALRFSQWLKASPAGPRILEIMGEDLGETGFHAIRKRLVESNDSTQIRQVLELLGRGTRAALRSMSADRSRPFSRD